LTGGTERRLPLSLHRDHMDILCRSACGDVCPLRYCRL